MSSSNLPLGDAIQELESSYDEIPYYLHSSYTSHPDRLHALAALHGVSAAPPNDCRVLELACGRGGSLVALAKDLPDAHLLGIDLSTRHIRDAKQLAEGVGAHNVVFRQADLMSLPDDVGEFDYIFAQGVFTWVPTEVRNKILAICQGSLSQNGLACIAYATKPGYYSDLMVRDMVLYNVKDLEDRDERLEQSKTFVSEMVEMLKNTGHPSFNFLSMLHKSMERQATNFYHEFLNVETTPLHLWEFDKLATVHRLKYLCETLPGGSNIQRMGKKVNKAIEAVPNRIQREQYKDFLTNRRTRESILCRKEIKTRLPRNPEVLYALHLCSPASPVSKDENLADDSRQGFVHPRGDKMFSSNPVTKQAIHILGTIWPETLSFEDLLGRALAQISDELASGEQRTALARDLLAAHAAGILELRSRKLKCTTSVGKMPQTSQLTRYFIENSDQGYVVNQRHETLDIDKMSKAILPLLDGMRTHDQIVDAVHQLAKDGTINFGKKGQDMEEEMLYHYVVVAVDQTLRKLARNAFLL